MRLESAEVRLSHMEYRIACLEAFTGISAYNTPMGWQMTTPFTMPSRPPLPPPSQVQQGQWQSPGVTMGGAASNIGLSFQDQQSLTRITPPSLPTTSLVEQQGSWLTQSPGFTIEAVTSNTGSAFSTLEQNSGTSALQQGPLLQVPPVEQYTKYLPASEIQSHQLRNSDDVIAQHRKLINDDGAGTLYQILAKEAFFGKDIMERCTVTGRGGTHALPFQPMNELKAKMFKLLPRYHTAPEQFEPVWKKCVVVIEQACGRLRRDKKDNCVDLRSIIYIYTITVLAFI